MGNPRGGGAKSPLFKGPIKAPPPKKPPGGTKKPKFQPSLKKGPRGRFKKTPKNFLAPKKVFAPPIFAPWGLGGAPLGRGFCGAPLFI